MGAAQDHSPPQVVTIEVKRAEKWDDAWSKPMRVLGKSSGIQVERMIGVYCGSRTYQFDNVRVWPVAEFVKALFAGEVF